MACIAVAHIELQEPAMMMMVGSCVQPPPLEPIPLQITTTNFNAEGVHLGPQQPKELKALAMEWDKQRTKATAEEDWCSVLDHTQHLFQALSILFELAHLLHHLLAVCHIPTPFETLLAKVLVAGQKKSLEAACQQIQNFGMELPPPPPPHK